MGILFWYSLDWLLLPKILPSAPGILSEAFLVEWEKQGSDALCGENMCFMFTDGKSVCHPKMTTWRQRKHSLHFPNVDISFGKCVFWNSTSPNPAHPNGGFSKKNIRGSSSASISLHTSLCFMRGTAGCVSVFPRAEINRVLAISLLVVDGRYLHSTEK